jgi:adenine specific DNA methylase Mod
VPIIQFKGKTAIESYHRVVAHHTLEIDGKLSLGKKPSLDGNLIIEGDNLIALKSLLPTHAGRIKCIYIDPPYNTGNEGWIYNDNLTQPQFKEWIGHAVGKEGEDACRHDKWCCMMYPRLQLLKELLRDDGAIFVSIDDNEVHHLRMLMDEVFGEENFVTALTWKTRNTDNRLKSMMSVDHEYVVIYAINQAPLRGRIIDRSDFDNPDNDSRGPYVTDPLTGKATAEERPNLHHTIVNPETGDKYPPDPARGWITDKKGMDRLIAEGFIWWPPNPRTGKPRKKRFLSQTSERMPASSFWPDIKVHREDLHKFGDVRPMLVPFNLK